MHAASPGPSILLVDDDDALRERLARALRERGFEVSTASDYDQAVDLAREDSPEMAVIDLRMPGRSGLEVVRALQEIDPQTRTVVLTGYGSIATAVEAVRLGAKYYLQKPADADEILAAFAKGDAPPLSTFDEEFVTPKNWKVFHESADFVENYVI